MFIINLTYKVEMSEVEKYFDAHIVYIKEEFAKGSFMLAGKKNPRNGGIVMSMLEDRAELEAILDRDPFKVGDVADYEVFELITTRAGEGFENLLK